MKKQQTNISLLSATVTFDNRTKEVQAIELRVYVNYKKEIRIYHYTVASPDIWKHQRIQKRYTKESLARLFAYIFDEPNFKCFAAIGCVDPNHLREVYHFTQPLLHVSKDDFWFVALTWIQNNCKYKRVYNIGQTYENYI